MESRHLQAPVATLQQRGAAASPGRKQKAAAGGDEKNRRALGDIGNRVNFRDVDGKVQPQISLPVARYAAQVLENAQPAEPDKKPAFVAANVRGKEGAKAAKPKVAVKSKTEEVIEISSGDEGKGDRRTCRKMMVHTLTSVLTARSKVACEVVHKPNNLAHDIDELDADDELAVVEYVEDIYSFYRFAERYSRPRDYMGSQVEINAKMRSILADWLTEVHHKFELMPETLYLTFYLIDAYLSVETVPRRELQLVGVSSMLVACKYEEIWAPQVNDFIYISDRAYGREQILATEKAILNKLEWKLTVPTPYVFLVRFLKAAMSDKEMENMAFFFAELGLMHYSMIIKHRPSVLAASAVYAARWTLERSPRWTETLERHTGYDELQLRDCAQHLLSFHASAAESKLRAVYNKYSSSRRGAVALRSPATKLL
ncbi:hypothetical protein OPV22_014876 [Ensete ventricosum]|uniref:Cyclin N-terminal domain-containing protein n=1 Tax=Ensete ventricosum TaxID=4639 RepID=A0AAV8R2J9_ENSVE|nr:hypothetical protein OPV22_014876 [Ensete ventricosum]